MCTKTLKHSRRNLGIIYKSQCTRPEYKDGLCKKHYDNNVRKLTNWGDRQDYRPCTIDEFNRSKSLKLKNSNQHNIYRFLGGLIKKYSPKEDKYVETNLPIDYTLFCIKYK